MRILDAEEIWQFEPIIQEAVEAANKALCRGSQRGAVLFRGLTVLGTGNNWPVMSKDCNPSFCNNICGLICNHAERSAIQNALELGFDLNRASLLHLKVKDGIAVPVKDLTCEDCSGYALRLQRLQGIKLDQFINFQMIDEKRSGYLAYSIEEWNFLSRRNLNLL